MIRDLVKNKLQLLILKTRIFPKNLQSCRCYTESGTIIPILLPPFNLTNELYIGMVRVSKYRIGVVDVHMLIVVHSNLSVAEVRNEFLL